eukprot:TRINITY_DN15099_c0_g5_i2.p1 TRINITY_DN15099_c0_g5~~TRINITY_DN15099_c0_g5_i2.p1  ORF type:complete len:695 (-),score=113.56 TRINITY_DN15099_c0_g5_i2:173-2032(-)
MVVADDSGELLGMVTENDLLRAYFEGTPPVQRVSAWLSGTAARAPGTLLKRLQVRPETALKEVAEIMVTNAIAGDCACHHVVVQEEGGQLRGAISSRDLVKVLCRPDLLNQHSLFSDMFAPPDTTELAASLCVRDVMKRRERVFTCLPRDTLKDALRVLLVSQQNGVLVADAEGIYGIFTARDAVKAFTDGIASNVSIAEWLRDRPFSVADLMIASDASLVDAAGLLAARDLDHLIVVLPGGTEAVGMVSSLDLLLRKRAHTPLMRSMPLWEGPTVGDVLEQQSELSEVCKKGTTLGEAARALSRSGRTSVIVEVGGDSPRYGLLTENDLVRAYIDGWAHATEIEAWLKSTESSHLAVPLHLQVSPSMHLTEAASLMLRAAEPGRPCHHLVVTGADGEWLGVFSSLDVTRALQGLSSEVEVAKSGADLTSVDAVMKPGGVVPHCKLGDTLRDALSVLDIFGQNAAFVIDKNEVCGLITSRCALQAFAEGVPQDRSVASWLQNLRTPDGPREVARGTPLLEAAALMTAHSLHHLLVVEFPSSRPVGLLSSMDIVRGVASINFNCPFVSLAWLRSVSGGDNFGVQGPDRALNEPLRKRPESLDDDVSSPAHSKRRLDIGGS